MDILIKIAKDLGFKIRFKTRVKNMLFFIHIGPFSLSIWKPDKESEAVDE